MLGNTGYLRSILKSLLHQHHKQAVRRIDARMALSQLTTLTTETWMGSLRNAPNVVAKAQKDWMEALNNQEINQRDLLFQQFVYLERISTRQRNIVNMQAHISARLSLIVLLEMT